MRTLSDWLNAAAFIALVPGLPVWGLALWWVTESLRA